MTPRTVSVGAVDVAVEQVGRRRRGVGTANSSACSAARGSGWRGVQTAYGCTPRRSTLEDEQTPPRNKYIV